MGGGERSGSPGGGSGAIGIEIEERRGCPVSPGEARCCALDSLT